MTTIIAAICVGLAACASGPCAVGGFGEVVPNGASPSSGSAPSRQGDLRPGDTTTTFPVTTVPAGAVEGTPPAPSPSVADTLACIRGHEQGAAGYDTNTGNGYYGAYQADVGTWGGYGGYATADLAPPAVQDAWAAELLTLRGLQPWPPAWNC